jgi:hypothetical protein
VGYHQSRAKQANRVYYDIDITGPKIDTKETLPMSETSLTDEHKEKYYSFQIKGWTNFDPMNKTLVKIGQSIEQGDGFLTLLEVQKTENDLASISDPEVKECFANILAAKRLVRNVQELPKNLLEELRSALSSAEGNAPKKEVASVATLPLSIEPRIKQWP